MINYFLFRVESFQLGGVTPTSFLIIKMTIEGWRLCYFFFHFSYPCLFRNYLHHTCSQNSSIHAINNVTHQSQSHWHSEIKVYVSKDSLCSFSFARKYVKWRVSTAFSSFVFIFSDDSRDRRAQLVFSELQVAMAYGRYGNEGGLTMSRLKEK